MVLYYNHAGAMQVLVDGMWRVKPRHYVVTRVPDNHRSNNFG